jgi:hypothetical protein
MTEKTDRIGKKYRFVLPQRIYYTGEIISEDELLINIIDRFGVKVFIGKSRIISMEEVVE